VANVNKKNELIGICGWVGSGKDTAANYLVGWHGFRRDSFAGALKDAVAAVFGWDRELLEGLTTEARAWREQVDPWWAERLQMPNLTPRWVLQYWGTEVCRTGFHDDIWIAALENRLRTRAGHTVISDVRFPNEVASIRNAGGRIIWIRRGADPEWCDTLVEMRQNSTLGICTDYMKQFNVHASEWAWVGTRFDAVIDNNSSVDELYEQLKNLV
jgi:hypothetical protein